MRTRRSASPAAASGDVGGGILASIPSLPSSSSRPSTKSSGSTAKTRRTSSSSAAAAPLGETVKNDGSSTTRRLRLEDEDASTSSSTRNGTGKPCTSTKSNAKTGAQRSAGESRSRQATKSSTSKRRPPVAPAPVVSSSSQNPPDRRKARCTSASSNANSAACKNSQKALPTVAIASRQKQQRTTPSIKVSTKENIDDAAASDDVLGTHAEGSQKAGTDASVSNQNEGGDGGEDGATCSTRSKGPGSDDDAPDAITKDTEKEPEQPEAMSANNNNVATTSTAIADADCTSPTKVRTSTTNSKGRPNRGGLPPKPVSSTTASATGIVNSATTSKKKAGPSKSSGGGKPPTPRSTISNCGRAKAPLPTASTPQGSGASGSAVRNGKPPTPRSSSSIAGNASAGDDDKSAAGTAATATGATKRTTFLSGYNLDCTETSSLLDLPDPPTPGDDDDDRNGSSLQDRKAKRRRRMSTGAAAFGSRRNIGTPSGGNGMRTGDDASLDNRSTSGRGDGVTVGAAAPRGIVFDDLSARARRDGGKGQRRKVRNSMCHVPSPAETSSTPSSIVAGNDTGTSYDDAEFDSQIEKPSALRSPDKESKNTDADKARDVDDKSSPAEKGGICFDDDDDDGDDDNDSTGDDNATKKRRKKQQQQRSSRSKKRQSVFLPSDLMHLSSASGRHSGVGGVGASIEGNGANEFYSDLLSYKASATSTASADSRMSLCSNASIGSNVAEQPSALCDVPSTSNLLLQAVREICSLPESKRYDSDQAGVVELLGGYPYIPPAEKERMKVSKSRNEDAKKVAAGEKRDGNDLNWTFSPSTPGPKPADDPPMSPVDPIAATLEKRRELILTLGPVVERMEAKRKEDTEAAKQATGCRASRTKKGRYKYYDLETGNEVSPEEYKRRYFAMISGNRGGDQNQSSDPAPSPEVQGEIEGESATVAKKIDSGDTRDLQEDGPDQESTRSIHDVSIDEDGDDMDISLMSMQDVEDVVSKDTVAEESGKEASNENDSFNIEPDASSTQMRGDNEVEAEEEKVASPAPGKPNQPSPSSSSSADFILPLPDRDDPDTDPQIAAAERRLWSEIDAALARYSRDVISIRAARKMGFTLSQTAESP